MTNIVSRVVLQRIPARLRLVAYGVTAALCAVLIVQLAYPDSRALPFSTVGGKQVGFATKETIARRLVTDYKNVPLKLTLPTGQVRTTFAKSGFSIDTDRAFAGVIGYPWWQRLVPFSLLVKGATTDVSAHMKADKVRYQEFVKNAFVSCRKDSVNAGVRVVREAVELSPAEDGYACDTAQLARQLSAVTIGQRETALTVPLKKIPPRRSDAAVAPLLQSARQALARSLTLQADDGARSVPASERARWLQFDEKSDDVLVLALNASQVSAYVKTAHAGVRIAPRPTIVSTLDGTETGRVTGASGREIDEAKTTAAIQKAWLESSATATQATVVTQTVVPPVQYSRTYSPTQAGLQALLTDIAKDKGDYGIAVRLSKGQVLQANGTKQYHPASTYKMYVAWAVLKRIETGQMKWSDAAESGKTVEQCFDAMIINSDNPCGEWFGVKIGWSNLNAQLKGIGLACTNLSTAWLSCAQDETLFLGKLETGQLLGGSSRDRLLDAMKRQVYRSGIPAGNPGVSVADKVGFINGYLHDAAIVYAPKGTYELTIMSAGSSWAQIADAAHQINAQLQRM